jgi:hypothetical protein
MPNAPLTQPCADKAQAERLTAALAAVVQEAAGPEERHGAMEVSTVDAFQGSEKEAVIVSCVRTAALGFSDAPQRVNVTITRARRYGPAMRAIGDKQQLTARAQTPADCGPRPNPGDVAAVARAAGPHHSCDTSGDAGAQASANLCPCRCRRQRAA